VTVESQIHAAAAALIEPGASVDQVRPFRRLPLPFPAELVLRTSHGLAACVVKVAPGSRNQPRQFRDHAAERLNIEAVALAALSRIGFDAPSVLAGPATVQTDSGLYDVLVMTRLPGDPLPWIGVSDIAIVDRTCRLMFEAIDKLQDLTQRLADADITDEIPRRTLDQELTDVSTRPSPWAATRLVQDALEVLHQQLPLLQLPLVFSNGDYNPLNVLADDAGLIGWVDFEHACFEDPLIGFPKFLFWSDDSGWALASQSGLVERYLYRHRVTPATFAVRVVLRGLTHLYDTDPDDPPTVMLDTIDHAVTTLRSVR
jgi:aminoglycoside phosphotransferase